MPVKVEMRPQTSMTPPRYMEGLEMRLINMLEGICMRMYPTYRMLRQVEYWALSRCRSVCRPLRRAAAMLFRSRVVHDVDEDEQRAPGIELALEALLDAGAVLGRHVRIGALFGVLAGELEVLESLFGGIGGARRDPRNLVRHGGRVCGRTWGCVR